MYGNLGTDDPETIDAHLKRLPINAVVVNLGCGRTHVDAAASELPRGTCGRDDELFSEALAGEQHTHSLKGPAQGIEHQAKRFERDSPEERLILGLTEHDG